jgi:hypothetical protein
MTIELRVRRTLSAFAVGIAAALAVPSASAALYAGEWDPAYGGIFPSLGWRASALIDVPNACLELGNAKDQSIAAGPCAGFSLLSAQLQLYDTANPAAILGTYALNTSNVVTAVDIASGALSGIESGYFDRIVPSLAIAGGGEYSFSLILFNAEAQLAHAKPFATSLACLSLPVADTECGFSANSARGVFTAVTPIPEPETWALMLAGLTGLGAMARRRARRGDAARA